MNLISDLTSEHEEIVRLINGFKKGKGFEGTVWRDELFAAKKLFLSHLGKEDTVLYPALMDAAKSDPDLSAMVSGYMKEMESISGKVLSFLDRYAEDHSGPSFSADYAELVSLIEKRVQSEETVLFAAYKRTFGY